MCLYHKKMLWLHRLQQRLSITRNEALSLTTLSALLVLGLCVRSYQQRAQPIRPDAYEDYDRLFSQLSQQQPSNVAGSPPPDSVHNAANETTAPAQKKTGAERPSRPLDINRATAAELEELPRIGPKTAERIISYRSTYGPFASVEDLTAVKGIGPKTLALLRPHLMIAPDSSSEAPR